MISLIAEVGLTIDAWIGLRNYDGYHWTDQSEVDYTNWERGEPNGGEDHVSCFNSFSFQDASFKKTF